MKKKTLISSLLIAMTIVSSSLVANAAASGDGIATGGFKASMAGSQAINTAFTSTPSNISNYCTAKFSGYTSYERQSSVNYGYSSVTAYAPTGAYYGAYGQHSYSYNGPKQFFSR
ncbi:hypothetical protein J1C67_19295 (plasmid) [Clostridium gasigenes]|uniref:hypothetical protein n=1 Tax=Clostridium gasigenes TaxID=94869 RepID=UPI00143838E9|nr:hypothetical protein [Clostridium gasigenes]NKF08825.1 hypothetical protein [Clostridium gasigenes]QSW21537.1 hypothetical protein J1C67_19295 [Clostridium gasigenes]